MKRTWISICGAAALLGPGAALGAAVPASRDVLRSSVCQTALEPSARAISGTAVMRPIKGTTAMQLRFDLLVRSKHASGYAAIRAGDLGAWLAPGNPTLGRRSGDVWVIQKQVTDLAAPATYRLKASYRWLGARRKVIGQATRLGPFCQQPELRPDLRVGKIQVKPASKPTRSLYQVNIANAGATAAGDFTVQFAAGGSSAPQTRDVPSLAAHAVTTLRFVGPACVAGVDPTVTIYPGPTVDDFDPANNTATITCPAS